jgi:hypothetical protein
MAYTKQVKAAAVLNSGFTGSLLYGDGRVSVRQQLTRWSPTPAASTSNSPTTGADLNETVGKRNVIQIAAWTDERNLLIAAKPEVGDSSTAYMFVATRLLETELRVGTADNDINAIKQQRFYPRWLHCEPLLD